MELDHLMTNCAAAADTHLGIKLSVPSCEIPVEFNSSTIKVMISLGAENITTASVGATGTVVVFTTPLSVTTQVRIRILFKGLPSIELRNKFNVILSLMRVEMVFVNLYFSVYSTPRLTYSAYTVFIVVCGNLL
jgi:hypothetical protein